MSTFKIGESAICTDYQNWYCGKIVRIGSVNVLDAITVYGVTYGSVEFALRESGLGKISLRDQIDTLSSPIARQLLGDCYDAMQDATLDAIQNPASEFARHINRTAKESKPVGDIDHDYLSQERELRILIYTRQVEQTGRIEFSQN